MGSSRITMKIEVSFKQLTVFVLGGCASMVLLWLTLNYYDDTVIWSESILSTAGYWASASVICYCLAVIENRLNGVK
jgi:hypothetical protein